MITAAQAYNAITKVIVRPAANRKGYIWEQRAVHGGNVQAVSPKTYDTPALAKRAGQRQVDILNTEVRDDGEPYIVSHPELHKAYLEVRR